jgi:hypothetical protein
MRAVEGSLGRSPKEREQQDFLSWTRTVGDKAGHLPMKKEDQWKVPHVEENSWRGARNYPAFRDAFRQMFIDLTVP